MDYTYYGIPCKPLITADSRWMNEEMDVPAAIDGPVLISAGTLSGFEFGSDQFNPYRAFKILSRSRPFSTESSSTTATSKCRSPLP